jgi:hypothetical protein
LGLLLLLERSKKGQDGKSENGGKGIHQIKWWIDFMKKD